MGKLPAIQFYPGDWRKDPGVQALDYYERGVWLEMLFLMHESTQRGRLLLNNMPMPQDALARILGLDPLRVNETVNKIVAYGVASVDEQGVIYCRRMVRDETMRNEAAEAGKNGGNPSLSASNYNRPGFVYILQRSDGKVKIGMGDNPARRLYKIRSKEKSEVQMLCSMPTEDMRALAQEMLETFSDLREFDWFLPLDGDVEPLVSTLKGKVKDQRRASYEDEDEEEDEREESIKPEGKQKTVLEKILGKYASDFYELWDTAVWVKIGKIQSARNYVNARKEGASADEILKAAKAQGPGIMSRAERNNGTPLHPATWLSQRRFLDDLTPTLFPPQANTRGTNGTSKTSWMQAEAEAERAKEAERQTQLTTRGATRQ